MTISNQTNRISAIGSGSTGQEVPFTFPITATSDLTVIKRVTATGVETTLTETTNFTVSITGDTGGTLTTVTAIETTEEIHIIRSTPKTQSLDLEAGGSFNAENIEDAIDKNTKLIVELQDAITRCVRAPATDAVALDMELPSSVDRASTNLGFDASGNATTTDDVDTFTTANAFWDDLTVKSPWIDVRAYGVTGDGTTDDTANIQAAIDAATAGTIVFFPAGTYQFTNLTITDSIQLRGAGSTYRWRGTSATVLEHTGAADAITIDNATATHRGGISLRDFELITSVAGAGQHGISMVQTSTGSLRGIEIYNVPIRQFGGSGIYASGTVFDVTLNRVFTQANVGDAIKVVAGVGTPSQWKFIDCFLLSAADVWAVNIDMNIFDFIGGTVAGVGTGHGLKVGTSGTLSSMNVEGANGVNTVGLQFLGDGCTVRGCNIYDWATGVKIGDGTVSVARGFDFVGDLNGNDTYDLDLTASGSRSFTSIYNLSSAQGYQEPVVDNQREDDAEAYGELTMWANGRRSLGRIRPAALVPSSPTHNDIYYDDGTNTTSGNPGWRRYDTAAWEDLPPDTISYENETVFYENELVTV